MKEEIPEYYNIKEIYKAVQKFDGTGKGEMETAAEVYHKLEAVPPEELNDYLSSNKEIIEKKKDGKGYRLNLKLDRFTSCLVNREGKLVFAGKEYNLLKKGDVRRFIKNLTKNRDGKSWDLVESIICHNYHPEDKYCVSINDNTWLPSFKRAHVENTCINSYITTYFDILARGKKTRVQIWKGHLGALDLTGAEISFWKPGWFYYFFPDEDNRLKQVEDDWFGFLWYPFMDNQLYVKWRSIFSSSGELLAEFGNGSSYEEELKWWAGKWTDTDGQAFSQFGKDYTIEFDINDGGDHSLSGTWNGKKTLTVDSNFPDTEIYNSSIRRFFA
jgi:hypothetical protein